MKKWIKRALVVLLLLMIAAIAIPMVVRQRMYSKPTWYPKSHLNAADQAAAANRADQKMIRARSEVIDAYAAQLRANKAGIATTTGPAGTFTLELTEDEINSWLPKWKDELGWGQKADKFLTDPEIVLHEGEIILAATVKDWNTIVSLHFLPSLDGDKFRLTLSSVMAGTLPLPKMAWSGYERRLLSGMESRLPEYQKRVEMDSNGKANGAAVSAAMAELLMHMLNDEPAEPVLFLPDQISKGSKSLPVHITSVGVEKKTLSLTVEPMDPPQRAKLLTHLKGKSETETAMSR